MAAARSPSESSWSAVVEAGGPGAAACVEAAVAEPGDREATVETEAAIGVEDPVLVAVGGVAQKQVTKKPWAAQRPPSEQRALYS